MRPFVVVAPSSPTPPAYLRLGVSASEERLARAEAALDGGAAALGWDGGAPVGYALDESATFDDWLAAEVCWRHGSGQPLPAALRTFAEFASWLREGQSRFCDDPLHTLEAVFAAVAQRPEAAAEERAERWAVLADAIWAAAARGLDPSAMDFSDPRFAREFSFLRSDLSAYQADVAAGQRCTGELPAGTTPSESVRSGAGSRADWAAGGKPMTDHRVGVLLLFQPRSLLFKYWSRLDADAPGGFGYSVLVVERPGDRWFISCPPTGGASLEQLAIRLQAAEEALGPRAGALEETQWFDGKRFAHTLIASPRLGSRLPREELLALLRETLRLKPISNYEGRAAIALVFAVLIGAGLVLWFATR